MLKSFKSPPDDHDGHLRNLLDQRNTRADVHGRLSAAASDLSDTPSVYSRSYFSPRPSAVGDSRVGHPYSSSISDGSTERFESHTSILNDQRTSYVSRNYGDANTILSEEVSDEGEIIARMSYLGPKMRVHSRAPWEEEAVEEADEENFVASLSFSHKHAPKNIASSPRPSCAASSSRQSEDSSISQLGTRRSFETVNSQVSMSHTRGGLYALAEESLSSNSLGRRTPVKEGFLNKLSIGRLATSTKVPTIPIPSPMSSPANNVLLFGSSRESSPINTHSVSSASSSRDSLEFLPARKASTHPYANPDLVVSYPECVQDLSKPLDTHYIMPHCDSEVTVTEPFSMEPMAKYNAKANTGMADLSVNSVPPKVRTSPINTKNISSPVTVISSPQNLHSDGPERLPGWTERSSTAPFTLISLEEARAKRMRTSTDATLSSSDSGMPFPGYGTNYSTPSSPLSNVGSRARGRSISAGANAKILGQPKSESRGPEPLLREDFIAGPPPGKTLKNKKSGFMRIFNRDKDLQLVPPVPSIPDGIGQPPLNQHLEADNIYRVPVPSLSHPEVSISQNGGSLQAGILTTHKNMKRSSPSLSITTTTQASPARTTPSSGPDDTLCAPSPGPQSAPPNLPEFPVLRLRPVSMLFSASFGDLVPSDPSQTAVQEKPLSSPPSSRFPLITPISPSRSLHDVSSVVKGESYPAVQALQEQLPTSKSAWERHIWELEGQVRDLKAELERWKSDDEYCDKCGRGKKVPQNSADITNRPRTRTGTSSRSVNPRT